MTFESAFLLIGGLGFFFLGMQTMSGGLKRVASDKLKQFLHTVTKHRIYGVFVGALTTLLVQSSSVTTVFVVGFVNASMLSLQQAIPLILGANIGTTFTAWLVSFMSVFKVSKYALPAVGIGFALNALGKGRRKNVGLVLMGFGILFTGLDYMKDAFEPLKDSAFIYDTFSALSHHPVLAVFAGIIFTVLLQSSSATIAIVQVMAFKGLIPLEAAIPIILGDNIGTTITAQLAAIGTNLNARRAAMSHTIFNVLGTAYMLVFVSLGWYTELIKWLVPGDLSTENIMIHIAVAHSVFNVINTAVFLPFINFLERLSTRLVPKGKDAIDYGTQYLEEHLLESPSLAMEQVHKEVSYMLKISRKAMVNATESFIDQDLKMAEKASELESVTDSLQSQITDYIVRLSRKKLEPLESESIPVLIHIVNDLERIGDHSQNISELTKRRVEGKHVFSDESISDIKRMEAEVLTMFDEAERAFAVKDPLAARRVLQHENLLNELEHELKQNHVTRLKRKKCKMDSGFLFLELIYNLEKIGDRLSNLGTAVMLDYEDQEHPSPA
ncbi:MAG: Na/Pi cotransporter family protein [Candidatus Omnitrophica bacterium]|nr:Na/Pi cotransporter family protein [Candidatus Omnitrophota bacterium]